MIKKTVLTLAVLYLLGIAAIWLDGITTGYQPSEYAVVLSNQVYPSGEIGHWFGTRENTNE